MPDVTEIIHNRILTKKWKTLKKLGLTPPRDSEENRKRAKEAHHGK